ncbi:MAG: HAD family hydrolase [Candidatus Poribacteria bacterium]|nr:HAD family hydrolase [Candidatus Poribacteria bacterium]
MIRALTFDFWQTLYADSPELNQKRQEIRAAHCHQFLTEKGHNCTLAEVDAGFQAAYALVSEMWHQHRGVTEAACMRQFVEALQIDLVGKEFDHFVKFAGDVNLDVPPVIVPFVKEVLPQLRAKYRLAVISDTGLTPSRVLRQLMEKDGILQHFTIQTFSDETTHTKPEVVQFHSTLQQLNAQPTEAAHIGDLVRTDIVGAKQAGMKAIRFAGVTVGERDDGLSDAVIHDYRQLESTLAQLDDRGP